MSVPQVALPVHALNSVELSSPQSNTTHPGSSEGEIHTSTTSKPETESEKPGDTVCSLVGICVQHT
jgi:hypothetical protein